MWRIFDPHKVLVTWDGRTREMLGNTLGKPHIEKPKTYRVKNKLYRIYLQGLRKKCKINSVENAKWYGGEDCEGWLHTISSYTDILRLKFCIYNKNDIHESGFNLSLKSSLFNIGFKGDLTFTKACRKSTTGKRELNKSIGGKDVIYILSFKNRHQQCRSQLKPTSVMSL